MSTTRIPPDYAILRELAVRAGVDPRTILRVFRNEPVRGMAGRRARQALAEAGLLPEHSIVGEGQTVNGGATTR